MSPCRLAARAGVPATPTGASSTLMRGRVGVRVLLLLLLQPSLKHVPESVDVGLLGQVVVGAPSVRGRASQGTVARPQLIPADVVVRALGAVLARPGNDHVAAGAAVMDEKLVEDGHACGSPHNIESGTGGARLT